MPRLIACLATALLLSNSPSLTTPIPTVPITDLLTSPLTYLGHEIAVSGKVGDVYSSHIFTLEKPALFHTGVDVIVLIREPDAIAVDGSMVTVTGVVQPFLRDEVASQFDLAGAGDDVLRQWETQPLILARSVRTSRGTELVAPQPETTGADVAREEQTATAGPVRRVSEISGSVDPAALAGRRVSMEQAVVQSVVGVRSFWIGTASMRAFVVAGAESLSDATRQLKPGDVVGLDGVIEPVPMPNHPAVIKSFGRLDSADASALARQRVYIFANAIHLQR